MQSVDRGKARKGNTGRYGIGQRHSKGGRMAAEAETNCLLAIPASGGMDLDFAECKK